MPIKCKFLAFQQFASFNSFNFEALKKWYFKTYCEDWIWLLHSTFYPLQGRQLHTDGRKDQKGVVDRKQQEVGLKLKLSTLSLLVLHFYTCGCVCHFDCIPHGSKCIWGPKSTSDSQSWGIVWLLVAWDWCWCLYLGLL